eukprot:g6536.t1
MSTLTLKNESRTKKREQFRRSSTFSILAGLFVGYCLYSGSRRGVIVANTSGMREEFGFDITFIGTLNSAFTAAYGISKFGSSVLCDFLPAKQLFIAGIFATGVVNIAMTCSPSLHLITFLWFINGLVQGIGWPALSVIILNSIPASRRGLAWSICTVGGNLGKTLSPLLLTIATTYFGWRTAFTLPGICAFLVTLFVSSSVPNSVTKVDKTVSKKERKLDGWWLVVCSLDFWTLCIVDFFIYFILQSFCDWTHIYVTENIGFSSSIAASGLMWFEMGGIASTLLCGPLSDFFGNRNRTSLFFTLFLLPGIFLLKSGKSTSSVVVVFFGLLLIGCGCYGPKTLCGLVVREAHPYAAGSAGALLGIMGQCGAILAGYPVSKMQQTHGWNAVLHVLFASSLFCLFGFAILLVRQENKKKEKVKEKEN